MWQWKKPNKLKLYEETLLFLKEHEETIHLINELIIYHRGLLNEKTVFFKGPIVAMIRFYEEDTKNQLLFLKGKEENTSKRTNEERIFANKLAIEELNQLKLVAIKIAHYEKIKNSLEKKLKQEEILEIKSIVEEQRKKKK